MKPTKPLEYFKCIQVEIAERFGVSQSVISRLWTDIGTPVVYVGNVDKVEEGVQLLRDDTFLTLNAGRNPTTPATASSTS
jgi:predicted transcriptional regulator